MADGKQIYSVTSVNNLVKALLDGCKDLKSIFVQGEISNYTAHRNGHHYFTLKDDASSISCVMFQGFAQKLQFKPVNGMKVTVTGDVSSYPASGRYQIKVYSMQQQGVGDQNAAKELLRKKLEAEGLFDKAHKKPLPPFPRALAVITSSNGDAVVDVIEVAAKRWPMTKIVVLPVLVEGPRAPQEIAGAIRYANQWKVADVIIVGRGGGKMEELWVFNDEKIARAIYDSEIPIITAVGHTLDVTIADCVADSFKFTPTDAAYVATPSCEEQRDYLEELSRRCEQTIHKRLEQERAVLEQFASRPVMRTPMAYINQKRTELKLQSNHLLSACNRWLARLQNDFARSAASLDALSPLKVLGRGYALATDESGRVIASVAETKVGDSIGVMLKDGSLGCRVETRKEQ